MIIAGSGPSAKGFSWADVSTKKGTVPSEYVASRHVFMFKRWPRQGHEKLMLYNRMCDCGKCGDCQAPIDYVADHDAWDDYWNSWEAKFPKASVGTLAVFMVVERWRPETIGLIGFDWVLDGNPDWFHDAEKEKQAILCLTNVRDLRDDTYLRRIRPPRGVRLPRFLSERDRTRNAPGVVHTAASTDAGRL